MPLPGLGGRRLPHLLDLLAADRHVRVRGGLVQDPVEDQSVQLGPAELPRLVDELDGLVGLALRGAYLRHLGLHGGHLDPVPSDHGCGTWVGLVAAGEQRRRDERSGGDDERGATAAVQRSLPGRDCAAVHKTLR